MTRTRYYGQPLEGKCVEPGLWQIEGFEVRRTDDPAWVVSHFGTCVASLSSLAAARQWIGDSLDGLEPGWSMKCAYCATPTGAASPCCDKCRSDIHAHCPTWPSCTRNDYGRPCNATAL